MSRQPMKCPYCNAELISDEEQEENCCDSCFGSLQDQVAEERKHPDDEN